MSDCGCDDIKASLISYDDAIELLLKEVKIPSSEQSESVKTEEAIDRILATSLTSTIDVPPLDNSAMDGYALITSDIANEGTMLPLSQRICAGEVGKPLEKGTIARIFTGAPIPENADAVVMQEYCEVNDKKITVNDSVDIGQNIRKAGEDIKVGDEILQKGVKLRAQELGLAASIGCSPLSVFKRIKVALFFTGDELVEPGTALKPGQIYDSNRYTLIGLLRSLNCDVVDLGIVPDDLESTKIALKDAAQQADIVITSGGVSVGEEDHVRIALEALGKLKMWRVAMKPGKPLAYGNVDNTPFMGLPGNPVSAFVTFSLFVAPFIRKMQGQTNVLAQPLRIKSNFEKNRAGPRREYLRAQLSTDQKGLPQVNVFPHQGSGVLMSTCWASGLVVIPIGETVSIGDMVEYFSFEQLLSPLN